ncbi:MAG TPA: hypothetical protein VG795_07495 [Acidimicrobiia bacterium]|nr:hypothetical protein [Acidimicrobiia bacterium]
MIRRVVLLGAVVATSVVGFVPTAGALGGAVCVISGTITFAPPAAEAPAGSPGAWTIGPGQIQCNGIINGYRIWGTGPFHGSGTYTSLPLGGDTCGHLVHHVGMGNVDYLMRSAAMLFRVRETKRFVLAGAGEFSTPSLRGAMQLLPPYEGDCVTTPITRATFAAQARYLRTEPLFLPATDGSPGSRP